MEEDDCMHRNEKQKTISGSSMCIKLKTIT